VTELGNKEILATIQLALNTQTEYGLSVDYDSDGNPIIKVAPIARARKTA
jgi:hypothetical protein